MRFALTGAAGYVAPRHMKAILETGNDLVAALDPHDSVGILDKFFPECKFFIEYERFDRYLEKLRRHGRGVDYISVCSPNYLHDAHCRLAMRVGADVICEKPVVSNPWNLDQLKEIEKETGKKIYVVLQLRYHPELLRVKESLDDKMHLVDIYYVIFIM
ncbi:MAG: Gfo/Idh/MocA family protein [Candidatus Helarchaeota archaeon]